MERKKLGYYIKNYPVAFFGTLLFSFLGGMISYYYFKKKNQIKIGKFFGRMGVYIFIINFVIIIYFKIRGGMI